VKRHTAPADQRLLDRRARSTRPLAQRRLVDGYRAPAEQRQTILRQPVLEQLACAARLLLVTRQEDHADRQILDWVAHAEPRQLAGEESPWDLCQHARAVAALAVGADTATMGHITQGGERHCQNVMAWFAGKPRHEADS